MGHSIRSHIQQLIFNNFSASARWTWGLISGISRCLKVDWLVDGLYDEVKWMKLTQNVQITKLKAYHQFVNVGKHDIFIGQYLIIVTLKELSMTHPFQVTLHKIEIESSKLNLNNKLVHPIWIGHIWFIPTVTLVSLEKYIFIH